MDRRFDHLDRTKADKSDLSRFVTKDDLKAELKRFATKDDLKRFATKDDLLATRKDVADLASLMRAQFANVNRQFDSLNGKIDSVLAVVREEQRSLTYQQWSARALRIAHRSRRIYAASLRRQTRSRSQG